MQLERTNLLLRQDQKIKAEALSKKLGLSLSEITREALDIYFDFSKEDIEILDAMANELSEANENAEKSIDNSIKTIKNLLKDLREKSI